MSYQAIKAANRTLNNQECLAGATRLKSKPLFFWFDLNGACNLECKHCGFSATYDDYIEIMKGKAVDISDNFQASWDKNPF